MGTKKKQRRDLGKRIRQETGLPLPLCMRAAKLIHRGDGYDMVYGTSPMFTHDIVQVDMFPCGPECCGSRGYKLVGPKGEYSFY